MSTSATCCIAPVEQGRAAINALAPLTHAQPALFALEYALARQWMHWGVIPTVVVADGLGALVAAVVAGRVHAR